jgi:hypothetical protein
MTSRGGGNPILDMAFEPRFRMGPPPRSFAPDAHDCIMVPILTDQPNTSLRREVAPDGELPRYRRKIRFAEPAFRHCVAANQN